jgi:hypothetical protein
VLKREFGFYCIELNAEEPVELEQAEVVYAMGGTGTERVLSSMDRYDSSSGQWSPVSSMGTARESFGTCVVADIIYVIGGRGTGNHILSSVEKYSPSSNTWSTVAPLLTDRAHTAAITVGSDIYVLGGGTVFEGASASVLKYDSVQDSWSEVAPMPGGRFSTLPVQLEMTFTLSADLIVVLKLRRASSSTIRRPTPEALWRLCLPHHCARQRV